MEGGDSSDFRSGGHAGFKKDDPIDKCDPGYYKPGAESFVGLRVRKDFGEALGGVCEGVVSFVDLYLSNTSLSSCF